MVCGILLLMLCMTPFIPSSSGQSSTAARRCYTCRSRGEQGDCRDPFIPPEELQSDATKRETRAVSDIPCSTGWCSKLMEGVDKNFVDDDYGIATERQCMQRAPSDNQERCAYVKYNHKQVYMCFCKGDLCNSAKEVKPPLFEILLASALFLPYFVFSFNSV